MFKVGDKVIRTREGHTIGSWPHRCLSRGFDPSGVFTVLSVSDHTVGLQEIGETDFLSIYFRPAVTKDFNLDDFM